MESFCEKDAYNQIADNIRENTVNINNILSNCAINSKIVREENKINEFLSIDTNELFYDGPKVDYYDLDQVAKVFDLLESSKPEIKKKFKIQSRTGSVSSLASTTSSAHSSEDISHLNENFTLSEIKTCLSDIRVTLENITDSNFISLDLNTMHNNETSKSSKFVDLVMSLQKLAKVLQNIASSDNSAENGESPKINSELTTNLCQLSQVSKIICTYFAKLFRSYYSFLDARRLHTIQ